jgi:hypothetical protein
MMTTPDTAPSSKISVPHFTPTFLEALEAEWYASFGTFRKAGISIAIPVPILVYLAIMHRDASIAFFYLVSAGVLLGAFAVWFCVLLLMAARNSRRRRGRAAVAATAFLTRELTSPTTSPLST